MSYGGHDTGGPLHSDAPTIGMHGAKSEEQSPGSVMVMGWLTLAYLDAGGKYGLTGTREGVYCCL